VRRFEREARALAALNHPHIAAIYDVLESDGQAALVLELIEGETLADRIARKALSITDALHYARQIADALDTAHEAGIVHRELKPGNITITDDGRVKVLDFGLVKAIAGARSARATWCGRRRACSIGMAPPRIAR
jgi:serine/threonine-protein kinase